MGFMQFWELASYVVTALGLPLAIYLFRLERRKERAVEEAQVHELLSAAYTDFLKLVVANPDLRLRSMQATPDLDEEQQDRVFAMFEILISVFERAYLLGYGERLSGKSRRRWRSWEDFMREWCRRDDFRLLLPRLLVGEDPAFAAHLLRLAEEAAAEKAAGTARAG